MATAQSTISILLKAQDNASRVIADASAQMRSATQSVSRANEANAAAQTKNRRSAQELEASINRLNGQLAISRQRLLEAESSGKASQSTLMSLRARVGEYERKLDDATQAQARLNKEAGAARDIGSSVGDSFSRSGIILAGLFAAGAATAAAGVVGLTSAITGSVKAYADYETSLNIFRSVSGATADQMVQVSEKAKALGNDVSLPGVSAADAANAMSELAKAGISVNDSLAASKGVLSLAKAGQLDVADAATIAARALNTFGLQGGDAGKVADLLAAGANSSTASVQDMAFALQQGGAGAKQFGISVNDTVAALALFSNAGINGSDAGTSLKTMLQNLANPTDQQTSKMKELGLSFFDAKGNFVGLSKTAEQLKEKLGKLSVEQKNQALATLFGSDSSRVAAILADAGAASFDKMREAVSKQGAAADLSASMNSGLNGAIENIKSTVETASINFGEKLAPTVMKVAGIVQDKLAPALDWATDLIFKIARKIRDNLQPDLDQFAKMWNDRVAPSLERHKPMFKEIAKIFGEVFVAALKAVVDAARIMLPVLFDFAKWCKDNQWVVLGIAAAVGAIATALMIQSTISAFQAAFTAAMTASAGVEGVAGLSGAWGTFVKFLQSPLAVPAIGIAAALIAIGLLMQAVQNLQSQIDKTQSSLDKLTSSNAKGRENARAKLKSGDIDQSTYDQVMSTYDRLDAQAAKDRKLSDLQSQWWNPAAYFAHALGTNYAPGGMTWVGENGPELVNMPRGSKVYNARESREMASQRPSAPMIGEVHVHNEVDEGRLLANIGLRLAFR